MAATFGTLVSNQQLHFQTSQRGEFVACQLATNFVQGFVSENLKPTNTGLVDLLHTQ